jgi:hypothetical protein
MEQSKQDGVPEGDACFDAHGLTLRTSPGGCQTHVITNCILTVITQAFDLF